MVRVASMRTVGYGQGKIKTSDEDESVTGRCKSSGCEYVLLLTNRRCINKVYSIAERHLRRQEDLTPNSTTEFMLLMRSSKTTGEVV